MAIDESVEAVSVERVLPAAVERVWRLVSEPEGLARWYASGGAELEPRVGAPLRMSWEEHGTYLGRVEQVQAPRLLAFAFASLNADEPPEEGNSTHVTFELTPEGSETRLRITEHGFATLDVSHDRQLEHAEHSRLAWTASVDALRRILAAPQAHAELVIGATAAQVFEAWANPEELPRWYLEGAVGDPRRDAQVSWILGGEAEPLQVTRCEPDRRLVLTHVGEEPWRGTVIDLELHPEDGGTRTVITQSDFSEALQDFVPNVHTGWICMLPVLKEYLERHAGQPREELEVHRAGEVDPSAAASAFSTADAMADWAGTRPARFLASAPGGAVAAFEGFPGLFLLMAFRGAMVRYVSWGGADTTAARAHAEALVERLLQRIRIGS